MNCDKAREILNTLLDGEVHPGESEAYRHLDECESCREWHSSMSDICHSLDAAREDVPNVDIAAAVMARLPESHPASRRVPGRSYPGLILAWLGASWLLGLLILAALGVAVYGWTASWSADRIVVGAIAHAKTASGLLGIAARNALSLLEVAMRVVSDASPAILSFLALDALFLFAVLVIIFGRRRVTQTSVLFC
ncbi:MAG: zf-HC2 domain-containing protein [Armatimonadetes bacterium]|nr:zf-HC2 domain-containing protein [Armatimonadota bacterium]